MVALTQNDVVPYMVGFVMDRHIYIYRDIIPLRTGYEHWDHAHTLHLVT